MIEIPVAWMLSTLIALGGVIATLAGIIYSSLSTRLTAQEKIIERLQDDIDRLSKGCGQQLCLWKHR